MAEEMISRTLRAFSRAERRQETIEFGLSLSNVKKSITFFCVATPYRSRKFS